jgi:hypothetical protein
MERFCIFFYLERRDFSKLLKRKKFLAGEEFPFDMA